VASGSYNREPTKKAIAAVRGGMQNEPAKVFLQGHWQDTDKRYLAVVHGSLAVKEGTISSYLAENSAVTVYSSPDPAVVKLSHTEYTVLKETKGFSLLEIHNYTPLLFLTWTKSVLVSWALMLTFTG
jgi:23S rRNA-/tRNA-specific pseudouridylate synthase